MPKEIKEASNRIMCWGYDEKKNRFVVKRFGGNIKYFASAQKLKSLPTWDIRALSRVKFINHSKNSAASSVHDLIVRECDKGFDVFRPQQAKRMILKHVIDPITLHLQINLKVKPADVKMRIPLTERQPECLRNFKKWYFDSLMGEAVIKNLDKSTIRVLDPMDLFSFDDNDLEKLMKEPINSGAGVELKNEARMYSRVATRTLRMRKESRIIEEGSSSI
jgi:hypothetical protein